MPTPPTPPTKFVRKYFSRKRLTREALIAQSLKTDPNAKVYQSDVPCLRGHMGMRYIKGHGCRQCVEDSLIITRAALEAFKPTVPST